MPLFKVITHQEPNISSVTGERRYHDENAIRDVVAYCLQPKKIPRQLVGAYAVNINQAAYEMERLARANGKDHGLRLRHMVLSFSPKEIKRFHNHTYETLKLNGDYAARYYGGQYQIIYAVHEDTDEPHVHFVMNTVNYLSGKKYAGKKEDYYAFCKYLGDFLYQYYGLVLIPVSDNSD